MVIHRGAWELFVETDTGRSVGVLLYQALVVSKRVCTHSSQLEILKYLYVANAGR
jgi:hypothetical protein